MPLRPWFPRAVALTLFGFLERLRPGPRGDFRRRIFPAICGAKALLLGALLSLQSVSRAEFQFLWEIGTEENPPQINFDVRHGFAHVNWYNDPPPGQVTRLPGDPDYNPTNNPIADDDFYMAGFFPAGFNGLTNDLAVPNTEPNSAFKAQLATNDETNRIHFILSPAQTGNLSRLRLSFELDLGGFATNPPAKATGDWFGEHDVVVRVKNSATNVTIMARRVNRRTPFMVDFNARDVLAQAGPNTIEFVRTGPVASGVVGWIA